MTKIICFFEYLLAFLIVINCNTIWARLISEGRVLILTLTCLLLINILLIIYNLRKFSKRFISKILIILLAVNIYNLTFILINKTNNEQYLIRFILILSLLIFFIGVKKHNNEYLSLLYKISNIILILAGISLIFYFWGSILNVINSNSTVFLSWGGEKYIPSYYNIYFETQSINIFGIKLIRNTGIFTEAPMYNFVLCISLSVELFLKEKKINSKIAILMITIITTITTTGIVIMSILISLSILFNKNKSNLRSILKYITFPIILLMLCGISMKFINDKMNASIGKTASFSVRVDDYKIGFEVLNDYKLNGVGFLNHDFVKSYMNTSERDTDVGGSNSIMIIVSQGGIYLSIIYLVAIISFFVITLKKRQRNLLIFNMIIAILMAVTNIPYTNIILLYLAMGLTSNIEEKNIIYN